MPSTATRVRESRQPALQNVELTAEGILAGRLIDSTGTPIAAAMVVIRYRDGSVILVSDQMGRFAVSGLRGGVCAVSTAEHRFAFRVWKHTTAPPDATATVALVTQDKHIVRGNRLGDCQPQQDCDGRRVMSSEAKYGLAVLALGGTAAYFALSRDNAS